ncbi:cytochrome P450 [Suillus discolor]|uniref:Cytochrome P450 n=1 Tax=Suillus discolor TaxID=1912936 RepID=A0A9P7JVQ6_9AGAM|nr:cytochrome P450 [Suillus discolor]KAG2111177.1 cytochrome P450 [Suillus discolor]
MLDLLTSHSALGLVSAAFAISLVLRSYFAKPKLPHSGKLPPGPALLPILGSALAVDVTAPWLTYKAWGNQYGDVVYTRLFGQDNIIINSERVARDLLDHRSQNYSDRPEIATNELFGIDYTTAFMRYGSRWRLQRKILQQSFRQAAVPTFQPMQIAKSHDLLLNLLEDPLNYQEHLEAHSGSVILSAVYSYDAARRHDYMIERGTMALELMLKELRPEVAAVFSAYPFLLRLPSWLPGMRLKRISPLAKELAVENLERPFAHTERSLAMGSVSHCMVATHLRELDDGRHGDSAWQKKAIQESTATASGAGTETTAAVLMNFVLVMILHPDVQQKAQKLVDSVVGQKRLPTFHDRPSLPYIDAILRECLRWHPVFPLAIMHAAVESDIYEGYYIPKGATVTPNVWAMCHNEDKYANAYEFNPDRFLNPDGTLTDDTVSFVWGFGRRICPGRHLAEASIWSAIVCMLAVFNFSRAKDETGKEIEIEPRWNPGLTVRPLPFPCSITPRNADMDITALQHLIRVSV